MAEKNQETEEAFMDELRAIIGTLQSVSFHLLIRNMRDSRNINETARSHAWDIQRAIGHNERLMSRFLESVPLPEPVEAILSDRNYDYQGEMGDSTFWGVGVPRYITDAERAEMRKRRTGGRCEASPTKKCVTEKKECSPQKKDDKPEKRKTEGKCEASPVKKSVSEKEGEKTEKKDDKPEKRKTEGKCEASPVKKSASEKEGVKTEKKDDKPEKRKTEGKCEASPVKKCVIEKKDYKPEKKDDKPEKKDDKPEKKDDKPEKKDDKLEEKDKSKVPRKVGTESSKLQVFPSCSKDTDKETDTYSKYSSKTAKEEGSSKDDDESDNPESVKKTHSEDEAGSYLGVSPASCTCSECSCQSCQSCDCDDCQCIECSSSVGEGTDKHSSSFSGSVKGDTDGEDLLEESSANATFGSDGKEGLSSVDEESDENSGSSGTIKDDNDDEVSSEGESNN